MYLPLDEDSVQIPANGSFGQTEPIPNLLVAQTLCDQLDHLGLPRRQLRTLRLFASGSFGRCCAVGRLYRYFAVKNPGFHSFRLKILRHVKNAIGIANINKMINFTNCGLRCITTWRPKYTLCQPA